ncbi:hypothetical protein HY385_01600 [Candidatus Daviesbacteria bacterium]|nr:hypothetical protein [Candidatus Daviesbacteria bacterium]
MAENPRRVFRNAAIALGTLALAGLEISPWQVAAEASGGEVSDLPPQQLIVESINIPSIGLNQRLVDWFYTRNLVDSNYFPVPDVGMAEIPYIINNLIVYGHNLGGGRGAFGRLPEIKLDDEIILDTDFGQYHAFVTSINILPRTDNSPLTIKNLPSVTLVTSFSPDPDPNKYLDLVVEARIRLVSDNPVDIYKFYTGLIPDQSTLAWLKTHKTLDDRKRLTQVLEYIVEKEPYLLNSFWQRQQRVGY